MAVFFHVLSVLWRVLLYFKYGRPDVGVNQTWYITWKSSAVGDEGSSLTALTIYLIYLKRKFIEGQLSDNF